VKWARGIGAFCLDVAGMIENGVKDIKTTVLGIWCGLMERITTGGYDPRGGGGNDAAASNGVWSKAPIQRGIETEETLAKTEYSGWHPVGQEANGKFPLVDFQKGNNLVSLRTVDTTGTTWMSRMQEHIVDLGTRGATVDGKAANTILDMRVQPGGFNAAKPLVEFGRQNGVTVIIKEFP